MKNKLTYFFSRFSMFGIGYFILYKNTGKDAWISILLGILLSLIILYIYKNIKEFFKGKNMRDTLNKTKIGKLFLLTFILFYSYLIVIILTLLPMFVNSFYLLYTPKILIIIPFLLLAYYISFKEKETLGWLSNLLCIFSLFIILTYFLLLTKYIDITNIMPIYTTKSLNIIKASFEYASITTIPQIATINYYTTFKDDVKNYLLGTLTNFLMAFFVILCLGEPLIKIYSFPEYAVLKQIKLLDFIENIENLSSFIWYFDLFIVLSTLVSNLKDIMPKKYNKLFYTLILIFIVIICNFFIGHSYRIIITLFYYYPIILGIFFLFFIFLSLYIKKSKKIKP